ncbi:uncharacterized protein Dvir_GJ20476, isoform C [Drosophila virilis]|uniref:Uncharacterized protein, isoform C n=1 Tax=Drosophila virilis TaxID=7244 RepID=A0A0Q9WES1_DROVI|nr:uncharacterized protein Dvir_GJ20476, isoform C [Drosophila virilis]
MLFQATPIPCNGLEYFLVDKAFMKTVYSAFQYCCRMAFQMTKQFHLDISHAFPEWRCGEDHLWQVLKYIQAIFADPLDSIRSVANIQELSNPEASKLLNTNRDAYAALVQESIVESKSRVYDTPPTEDPHYIVFEKFQANVHGPVLDQIRKSRNTIVPAESGVGGAATGLSWVKVKEGDFKPLSIE